MISREGGRETSVSDSHLQKQYLQILVTELGMTIMLNFVQPSKQRDPSSVTLEGMSISTSDAHPLNALFPSNVMPEWRLMHSSDEQPSKALLPICVVV